MIVKLNKAIYKSKIIYLAPVVSLVLLSVIYAFIYRVMVAFNNETFMGLNQSSHAVDFLYYSVITASTTGYGDIYPLTKAGKIVNATEVILGILVLSGTVLYLTVHRIRTKAKQL